MAIKANGTAILGLGDLGALESLANEPYLDIDPDKAISFGREYFIPKPSDFRLLGTIAPAVERAAIESGVTKLVIDDFGTYAND